MNGDSMQISRVVSSQPGDAGGLMTFAPPTTSIGESPGIHSTACMRSKKHVTRAMDALKNRTGNPWPGSPPLLQIRHKAANLHPYFVDRSCRRDIERAVVLVAPGEIRGLGGNHDCPEVAALLVPHPDTLWPGDKQISLLVHLQSVGYALAFTSGLLAENPTVLQRAIGRKIIDADIPLLAVIYVEALAIGRESQSIGLRQIFGQKAGLASFVEPINALERNFLRFSLGQIERGIGEINGAVGPNDHIVRTVEPFSFEMVRENGVLSIRANANNRAQYARAIEQPELPVKRAPVRIAQGDQLLFVSVGINSIDLVDLFVADIKKPGLVPHRPLGESKSTRHRFQLRIVAYQFPECRRFRAQLEFVWWVFGLRGSLQSTGEKYRGEPGRRS